MPVNTHKYLHFPAMAQLRLSKSNYNKGFSLLEVMVALFIFGTVGILLFQNLSTTTYSIYHLERQYLARELAHNRLVYLQIIKRPYRNYKRNIPYTMGGRKWMLHETIHYINTKSFYFKFQVKEKGNDHIIYETSNLL